MLKQVLGLFSFAFLLFSATTAEGPLAYYPMKDGFKDASGNGNDLTAAGEAPAFSQDSQIRAEGLTVYGPTAGEKNGASGKIAGLDIKKGLTICGFAQFSNGNNYNGTLFGFGFSKWGTPGYLIELPYGVVKIKAGSNKQQLSWKRAEAGLWTHLALVLPPDGGEKATLYINGEEVASCPAAYVAPDTTFRLGTLGGNQAAGKKIAEVKVFNRALSPEELKEEAKVTGKIVRLVAAKSGGGSGTGKGIPVPRRQKPESEPEIRGITRVQVIDRRNIALVGYYQEFLNARFEAECGPFLKLLEDPQYKPQDWSRNFHYNFAAQEIVAAYRPKIAAAYQNTAAFSLECNGKPVKIARGGYWLNPISAGRFTDFGKKDGARKLCKTSEITHIAYCELAEPLPEGGKCVLTNPLGEKTEFISGDAAFTSTIKVNQVGYPANNVRKYAYCGMWRGPELGALDVSNLDGKEFQIISAKNGKTVYTGKIARRMDDVSYQNKKKPDEKPTPFTGEIVCDLDFSGFTTPGEYRIRIPGIGTSWDFGIGNNAVGDAFYIRMKGMYQKRCGTPKEKPYTNWTDGACHTTTYVGKFAPNISHYWGGKSAGFFDDNGKPVKIPRAQFIVIAENCSPDKIATDVLGGWHDAADYDRRPFHQLCSGEFTAAYLMFPQNFSDGQLNIPESGNGIPDLLDEARWGLDVWRKAQNFNGNGGVGCWIEASGHPGVGNITAQDKTPYYLALPTREGSDEYAGYAAALALALHKAGAEKESELFAESAKKALEFASAPANQQKFDITLSSRDKKTKTVTQKSLHYHEGEKFSRKGSMKAALDLYLLTRDEKYLKLFKSFSSDLNEYFHNMGWSPLSALFLVELVTETDDIPALQEERKEYTKWVLQFANERQKDLDSNYPYRTIWYSKDHPYVTHMSWGNGHPLKHARNSIVAYRITKEQKYRDAVSIASDFQLGANPTGASWTSGLGHVYPVRFLDIPSEGDNIEEFVIGITPYRNTFGLPYQSIELAYGIFSNKRPDHQFDGLAVNFLPKSVFDPGEKPVTLGSMAGPVRTAVPIWRRFGNVEIYTVAASEYTVNETMSIPGALTGCLLEPGYQPSDKIKFREPAKSITELDGLFTLP